MRCRVDGCPGEYEEQEIAYLQYHNRQRVNIDHVPALVCPHCGEEIIEVETH